MSRADCAQSEKSKMVMRAVSSASKDHLYSNDQGEQDQGEEDQENYRVN